ncbi:cyanobactin maturation protease PatG family protein [Leptothoe spongobia]|uniref:PatG C-terminal domain-containing protein n=1 Tax=Leptothoe spongobia TAU-MAC 1115 TaxID=1967444 RepID=A0A947GJI0_9CYAN|nr:hypothetical protein [Leptothoe spongobia]MBT9316584.1 hypothetical protein [Leptothoe spongobia TAU-MAC 1115]
MDSQYVYAVGTVVPRFPNMSLEKEYKQAVVQDADTEGQSTRMWEIQYSVLNKPENRYIARDLCWVFSIQNVDTYILEPKTNDELQQLINMLPHSTSQGSSEPSNEEQVDVVIGDLGPIAPPEKCNGLQLPIVILNNTYSFTVQEFLSNLRQAIDSQRSEDDLLRYVFKLLMQLADNVGNLDEHRAVNYVALRYHEVYKQTIEQYQQDPPHVLDGVNVQMSRLNASGTRRIVEVIFTYRNDQTDVKTRFYASVDVGGMFPFLVDALQPYYERPSF